ncbi:molybdopterin-dependent oxidoreductase [Nonomuraea fuscirosea]
MPNLSGFRYFSVAGSVPRKNDTNYRLTVDGLVDRPAIYKLDDLRAMPQTRIVGDVECTDGWRVPRTPFEGVPLSDLLELAGVRPEGKAIRFTCFDSVYSESLTLTQARRPDVLIALKLLHEPMPHERSPNWSAVGTWWSSSTSDRASCCRPRICSAWPPPPSAPTCAS